MKVNFDGLRRNAIRSYNNLIKTLKENHIEEGEAIKVTPYDIVEDLDNLRNSLVTLACMYHEGEDGFSELEDVEIDFLESE
jgi:hypothetical protein